MEGWGWHGNDGNESEVRGCWAVGRLKRQTLLLATERTHYVRKFTRFAYIIFSVQKHFIVKDRISKPPSLSPPPSPSGSLGGCPGWPPPEEVGNWRLVGDWWLCGGWEGTGLRPGLLGVRDSVVEDMPTVHKQWGHQRGLGVVTT